MNRNAFLRLSQMALLFLESNTVTHSACVSACDTAGAWRTALLLGKDMDDTRVEKNLYSFNALMSACPWQESLEVKELARSEGVRCGSRTPCIGCKG